MRKLITLSRPASGLHVGLCDQAITALGGAGSRIRLSKIEPSKDDRTMIYFVKDQAGPGSIASDGRFQVTAHRLLMQSFELPEFGPTKCEWDTTGNGIMAILPPLAELDAPLRRTYKGRELGRRKKETMPTPYQLLGNAIRAINELCASGDIKDVTLAVSGLDPIPARDFRIVGKRVVEEILS